MSAQRTPEWFAARLGKVTASRICDVTATIKTGEATSRRNYRAEKVLERVSGIPQESGYKNGAMQYGIDNEATARAAYCFDANTDVAEVGFIPHPTIANAGASPDGLIGDDGLVEIKCPEANGYLEAALGKIIDKKYLQQMMWQMACTGRQWCDFAVYREGLDLICQRVMRDDKMIAELEAEVRKFLAEVDGTLETLARK